MTGKRSVLLIAFHFPPDASSTGRLRTLGFARYMPDSGWSPVVLSPSARAYERIDEQGLADIADHVCVRRTGALDTRRHFGWRGKYLSWLAVPDRWIWWWPTAVSAGLALRRRHRISVIWSTYPIGTTHLIALTLARWTGLPWIADFRDPVVARGTWLQRKAAAFIERQTFKYASRVVFTTPGSKAYYAKRFPEVETKGRLCVIPNGFEEEAFLDLDSAKPARTDAHEHLHLVHSGLLYNQGRNPEPFFEALAILKRDGTINQRGFRVTLRASGHEDEYQRHLNRLEIADIVSLAPPIAYREALREQAGADVLLLFQGKEFKTQIPAKVFEYLRIGRPIFALTEAGGDTATLLDETGGAFVSPIDDVFAITTKLRSCLESLQRGESPPVDESALARYSRQACTRRLAVLLDEVLENER